MSAATLAMDYGSCLPKLQNAPKDRFAVIRPYVQTGTVLDLGCVDSRPKRENVHCRLEKKPNLLFQRITRTNPQTLGVDIDAQGVEVLRQQGFDVECADLETMDLGRRFDTIVAGELIEHLENPGLCLRNIHRHLKDDGLLILSTPNPFSAHRTWKIWWHGFPNVHEDHTCWFDPITLHQLLRRTGFETISAYWIQLPGKTIKTWPRLLRPYFARSFMLLARPMPT